MGDDMILFHENGITRYSQKGRIAYDKILSLKEMDLEPYRQEAVEAWKITIQ